MFIIIMVTLILHFPAVNILSFLLIPVDSFWNSSGFVLILVISPLYLSTSSDCILPILNVAELFGGNLFVFDHFQMLSNYFHYIGCPC